MHRLAAAALACTLLAGCGGAAVGVRSQFSSGSASPADTRGLSAGGTNGFALFLIGVVMLADGIDWTRRTFDPAFAAPGPVCPTGETPPR